MLQMVYLGVQVAYKVDDHNLPITLTTRAPFACYREPETGQFVPVEKLDTFAECIVSFMYGQGH